jgi:hypothetical protein
MDKKLVLTIALASAGAALLFGAGSSDILKPHPAVPQAAAEPKAQPSARDEGAILRARGKILAVHAADRAKKRAGWIVLRVAGKKLGVVVYAGTPIKGASGGKLRPTSLRVGETVDLSYRQGSGGAVALSIRT